MRKVRKAVITAAGRGTRHYPASAAIHKELFPLVDRDGRTKPLIQLLVEQHAPEGFGHAVYQARRFVGDDPFLLLLGDHVFISDAPARCARQAIDVFEENDLDVVTAVQLTTERDLHLFGTLRGKPIDAARGRTASFSSPPPRKWRGSGRGSRGWCSFAASGVMRGSPSGCWKRNWRWHSAACTAARSSRR